MLLHSDFLSQEYQDEESKRYVSDPSQHLDGTDYHCSVYVVHVIWEESTGARRERHPNEQRSAF